jgi:hypothetical protein
MKINWKPGFLAAMAVMALNVPYLSAQKLLFAPNTPNINPINTQLFSLSNLSTQSPCFIGYNSDSGTYQTGVVNLQGGGSSGPLTSSGLSVSIPKGNGIKNMTHFQPFNVESATYFIAYDSANGRLLFDLVTSVNQPCDTITNTYDSSNNSNTGPGPGLTHIMPFSTPAGTFLMTYDSAEGFVEFVQIMLDSNFKAVGYMHKGFGSLGTGFTHLMPYTLNGVPGFIAYNANNGAVQLESISTSTFTLSLTFLGNWGTNWTHFVPALAAASSPYFLRYSSITGAAEVDTILGTSGIQTNNVLTNWAPGVTLFAPFEISVKSDNSLVPDRGFLLYFPNGVATVWEF